jgi:polysaccharide biosynthesis protein PelG
MAGIGFRLQSLVEKGSILGATTAYLSATVITAGPWLSGVAALFIFKMTASSYLSESDRSLLLATIVVVFAASLIVAGGPQMLITRYVADRLYLKDTSNIAATSTGVLFLLFPLTIIALPFFIFSPFNFQYRLLVTTLFLTLSMILILMLFLSAASRYMYIVVVFLLSYAVGIVASFVLGLRWGLLGSLGGFTAGQILCLSLLIVLIYREFPASNVVSFAYLGYFRHYWILFLIGALYALSVWVDSFLFWISPHSLVIAGFYHLFPPYDTAKFIAALSTVPAAVIFVVHLETNFDRYYQSFYSSIHNKGTLSDLMRAREGMRKAVYKGLALLLKVQGLFAIFLCLIGRDIAVFISLPAPWVPLMCMSILASTCQFITFIEMLLLLYIDQRRTALVLISLFILCNVLLTLLTLRLGPVFYGAGNLLATSMGSVLGLFLLSNRLKHLERLTFMTQSLV